MSELGFPRPETVGKRKQQARRSDNSRRRRGGGAGGAREVESPDSVLLFSKDNCCSSNTTTNSVLVNSSSSGLLSSGSASGSAVGRCSFGSDYDALLSQLSLLAGCNRGCGPDLDREKRPSCDINSPHKSKECQNRRFRSEAFPSPAARRHQRERPASLDLNSQGGDVSILSPQFFTAVGSMKKSSVVSSRDRSGTFPSPGTPNYGHGGGPAGYNKGWSSERVPLPVNSSRRYGSSAALLPFKYGKTLPSKWEDAEKWILSPVSGDGGIGRASVPPPYHRRPKSKSGPLGAPMEVNESYSSASPLVPGFAGGRVRNFTASSPFPAGVLVADHGCCGSGAGGDEGGGRRSYSANADPCVVRSASVHGWSDLLIESSTSLPSSQDEELDITGDVATMMSLVALRKDMATQMSPEGSADSSPKERHHGSPPPPSAHSIAELQSHFSKLEVRDVQVDDRVTVTRWSKKHIARGLDKGSRNIIEWRRKTVQTKSSAWEVTETAKCISKFKREEAKITAWENLQKAKAEAAIRKLEMRLEKKRSSSMDKILNKLRSSQRKAQEMRNEVNASQAHQVARTSRKALSFRRASQIGSLSGCFTCPAF